MTVLVIRLAGKYYADICIACKIFPRRVCNIVPGLMQVLCRDMAISSHIYHSLRTCLRIGYGSCVYHARSMDVWCKESCIVLAKNLQRPFDTIAMRPPSPHFQVGV